VGLLKRVATFRSSEVAYMSVLLVSCRLSAAFVSLCRIVQICGDSQHVTYNDTKLKHTSKCRYFPFEREQSCLIYSTQLWNMSFNVGLHWVANGHFEKMGLDKINFKFSGQIFV